ncbi:MAG: OB-fold nucleic acid binding domain-containing protein [Humibacillus sp.]|nr:OB-fold nucleic acid binding domain-containing protein [Humibacillus sp.]MDN5778965.1 OB-fold nucleic acid binding domain-containing protein [Humibacillus sp.]
MGSGRPGGLRRLTERLTRSSDELNSDALKQESNDLGVVHIGDVEPRTLATVCGEVRSVTLRPRDDVPALDVELWDGTDSLHLIWLGRRRIAGIAPGIKVQATGRITRQREVTTIFNPAYEIIGRPGAGHD